MSIVTPRPFTALDVFYSASMLAKSVTGTIAGKDYGCGPSRVCVVKTKRLQLLCIRAVGAVS